MPTKQHHAAWMEPLRAEWRAAQTWTLERQIALAQIAAPTGNESARARYVQQWLSAVPAWAVAYEPSGNVVGRVLPHPSHAHESAPLVCLSHLDTVYATAPSDDVPLQVQRDGAQLACPGIGDNSRGLAAMLALAHALAHPAVRDRLTRPVYLVATVGEEGDGNLRGARDWFDHAAAHGVTPCAAIAIDGPGDESIVHHAVGSIRLRISVRGPGGHSWVHAGAPNPIHALGAFITQAVRVGNSTRRDCVVTVTRMYGGESLTGVPSHAWVDLDVRGTSDAQLAYARRELVRLAHDVTNDASRMDHTRALSVEVTVLGERPAGVLAADHPLVVVAQDATQAVGRVPRSAVASTDANIPLSRGIPAIALGAGGCGGDAHTEHEWYDDTTGPVGLERVIRLVLAIAATQSLQTPADSVA